ncbi:protease [Fowl aviadenovirus A]|uniref:Protease n=3 Tax=Fowl aviadenovirus A TaxID=190061 RepID=PRO_ADEG1|nr:L3 protease [Fowl aviadenovirus A]AP_000419.1 protease [Fowl aviadenovirus A]P42672.1 RecName: Full=Protease; AltName: Full=Adenain; AltName: Full=Adenovirus protease; Short=AVP; AltName: Full=Adenovirus proteinase; AltName: Full=Endoprotease [Fowl aviadenovirus 1]AAA51402.1 endopeptidase [Fowl aviadenovirus 1]AAC54913.1 L3 protease [Fowl aviadenovirus 1]APP94065.1 L3 protease [Fowl aviadenovirus A]APP94098.1 L3 protease [Fowl aviadenovirus A]ASU56021.1 L3 protease [Fowl aviadenovirus A]
MSGTTETQLRDLLSSMHLRHRFLGVFDKSFPGFLDPHVPASAIVNTGSRASGGMHWIGFAFDPAAGRCYMFDPFGWSDQKLWELYRVKYNAFMRRTGLRQPDRCFTLVRSTEAVQCPCSAACGLFSALFIVSFDRYRSKPMDGNPVIDTVVGVKHENMNSPPYRDILHRNQERTYYWWTKNSAYFRAHQEELRRETALNALPENHV